MHKFNINVSTPYLPNSKTLVSLSFGDCLNKIIVSWLYTGNSIEEVLQNKEYYQNILIKSISNNIEWEEN